VIFTSSLALVIERGAIWYDEIFVWFRAEWTALLTTESKL
jgi:hypothetical protein